MRYESEGSRRRGHPDSATDRLARGLGLFSIGLGLAEFVAPRALARAHDMPGNKPLIRAYGAREIATGVAILASDDPTPWIWGRVAGDVLDLATLTTSRRKQSEAGQPGDRLRGRSRRDGARRLLRATAQPRGHASPAPSAGLRRPDRLSPRAERDAGRGA